MKEDKQEIEFLDYITLHPIPDKKEDMTDVDFAMKDIINVFVNKIDHNLTLMYIDILNYVVYQEEIDTDREMIILIQRILHYEELINKTFNVWFYEDSPIRRYCPFKEMEENAMKFSEEYSGLQKYKGQVFLKISNIYDILKQDARTQIAKKYFWIEEEK